MPEYLAPGVFVEEVSYRAKSIEGVSTTTTGMIGPTRYGPVDLEPDIITSLVEFERTQHMTGNAIAVHGGLTAVIQMFAAKRGVPCVAVHNATLKKHIAGNGRASKAEVAECVRQSYPHQAITSSDQSDALAVLAWAIDTQTGAR